MKLEVPAVLETATHHWGLPSSPVRLPSGLESILLLRHPKAGSRLSSCHFNRFISIPIQTKLQISHSQSTYGFRILLPGTLSWFVPGTFPKPLPISTYLSLFLPRGAAAKAPKRLDLGTLRERSSAARLKTTATSPAVQEQLGPASVTIIDHPEDPEDIRGSRGHQRAQAIWQRNAVHQIYSNMGTSWHSLTGGDQLSISKALDPFDL